jgi:membrane protein YqaA with SNARE-associated domain
VRAVTQWVLSTFTSPVGLMVLAALDSTLFFWLPFGVDAATIVFAMRGVVPWWVVAFLATAGSLAGAALTFWIGARAGDSGLERFIDENRLERTRQRIRGSTSTPLLAGLSLIPPPFPFTPIVLAAGALDVRPAAFFGTLAISRFVRFAAEAYLARRFGPTTLDWLESDLVQNVVLGVLVLGLVLTTATIIRLVRKKPTRHARRARKEAGI